MVQVAAGEAHTLFLTQDSKVYAVGDNSQCQLARSHDQAPYIHQPIQITTVVVIWKTYTKGQA